MLTTKEKNRIVKNRLSDYLIQTGRMEPGQEGKSFCCPFHDDKHPSARIYHKDDGTPCIKCFVCSPNGAKTYDTFDLIAHDKGLEIGSREAFKAGYAWAGIPDGGDDGGDDDEILGDTIDYPAGNAAAPETKSRHTTAVSTADRTPSPIGGQKTGEADEDEEVDFSEMVDAAHECLLRTPEGIKHFTDRGISLETIKRHKLGYLPHGLTGAVDKKYLPAYAENYRYIFPNLNAAGDCTFFEAEIYDRNLTGGDGRELPKYANPKGLKKPVFNGDIISCKNPLDSPDIVFITEGIYDALSVEEAGGEAVATLGAADTSKLIEQIEKYKPSSTFMFAFDNDKAGIEHSNEAGEAMGKKGIDVLKFLYPPETPFNDFNEGLTRYKDEFIKTIQETIEKVKEYRSIPNTSAKEYILTTCNAGKEADFEKYVKNNFRRKAVSTGWKYMDKQLDGGLYPGLYIMGAVTGMGKTALCLQMADQIAAAGKDVIYISLEISRNELMARSISRLTNGSEYPQTTRNILNGDEYGDIPEGAKTVIRQAKRKYFNEIAPHFFIFDGLANITVTEIERHVMEYMQKLKRRPVVFVDYLQIVAPNNERMTDKQVVDYNVVALKRLSRDYDIPVVVISSFNRDSYKNEVGLVSFKESGSIEYSSDVLLGLQPYGVGVNNKTLSEVMEDVAKKSNAGQPVQVELHVLKNRNGRKGIVYFDMTLKSNTFMDISALELRLSDDDIAEAARTEEMKNAKEVSGEEMESMFKSKKGRKTKKGRQSAKTETGSAAGNETEPPAESEHKPADVKEGEKNE